MTRHRTVALLAAPLAIGVLAATAAPALAAHAGKAHPAKVYPAKSKASESDGRLAGTVDQVAAFGQVLQVKVAHGPKKLVGTDVVVDVAAKAKVVDGKTAETFADIKTGDYVIVRVVRVAGSLIATRVDDVVTPPAPKPAPTDSAPATGS